MKIRKQALGTRNIVGVRVEQERKAKGMKQKELLVKLQNRGIGMNASALSKLEGQVRFCTDRELSALGDALGVSADRLLGRGRPS